MPSDDRYPQRSGVEPSVQRLAAVADMLASAGGDPTDPYARAAQTFPTLTAEMIGRAKAYGVESTIDADTTIIAEGDAGGDFFVVIDGVVGIFEGEGSSATLLVRHDAGHFTGELDLLNARRTLVSARVIETARVLRIARPDFRRLMAGEPDIGEIVMRALILRRIGLIRHEHGAVTVLARGRAGDALKLQSFLTRNAYPFHLLDIETNPDARNTARSLGLVNEDYPVVIGRGGVVLRRPELHQLADLLGLKEALDGERVYDLAIVGSGPGGLAAAVYGASEGLDTVVIEELAPGGQAGTSSRIENYLGFPTGISGQALAGRAHVQAQKFGAKIVISRPVERLDCSGPGYRLGLAGGEIASARAILVATGARYRKLDALNYERFDGRGIHYAATTMEGTLCADQPVVVVGGGNSAGQAAVFLSRIASRVHLLVRGTGLAATMSDYLVERIGASGRISLHTQTSVTELDGDAYLQTVAWRRSDTGETGRIATSSLFVMVGADPNTEWLGDCVRLDPAGFVLTGDAAGVPSPFQTSRPGIFAIGDVRAGSVKRVASAVGEGSVVVSAIHRYLVERGEDRP